MIFATTCKTQRLTLKNFRKRSRVAYHVSFQYSKYDVSKRDLLPKFCGENLSTARPYHVSHKKILLLTNKSLVREARRTRRPTMKSMFMHLWALALLAAAQADMEFGTDIELPPMQACCDQPETLAARPSTHLPNSIDSDGLSAACPGTALLDHGLTGVQLGGTLALCLFAVRLLLFIACRLCTTLDACTVRMGVAPPNTAQSEAETHAPVCQGSVPYENSPPEHRRRMLQRSNTEPTPRNAADFAAQTTTSSHSQGNTPDLLERKELFPHSQIIVSSDTLSTADAHRQAAALPRPRIRSDFPPSPREETVGSDEADVSEEQDATQPYRPPSAALCRNDSVPGANATQTQGGYSPSDAANQVRTASIEAGIGSIGDVSGGLCGSPLSAEGAPPAPPRLALTASSSPSAPPRSGPSASFPSGGQQQQRRGQKEVVR